MRKKERLTVDDVIGFEEIVDCAILLTVALVHFHGACFVDLCPKLRRKKTNRLRILFFFAALFYL